MGIMMMAMGYTIIMIGKGRITQLQDCSKLKSKKMSGKPRKQLREKKKAATVPDESQNIENIMRLKFFELKLGIRLYS